MPDTDDDSDLMDWGDSSCCNDMYDVCYECARDGENYCLDEDGFLICICPHCILGGYGTEEAFDD